MPLPDRTSDDSPLDRELDRRQLVRGGIALAAGTLSVGSLLAACGGNGMTERRMPEWMMGGGGMMDARMMEDMRVIRALLFNHDRIRRDVDDIASGIRARTTSADPEIAELIRSHVAQMRARVEDGDPIRHMDPLFREIFRHHEAIEMEVERVPGGVLVVETSSDPQVTLLVRQHARRAVSEFAAEGMVRAMRPTPLPTGYRGS